VINSGSPPRGIPAAESLSPSRKIMQKFSLLATVVACAASLSAQTAVAPSALATSDCCSSGNIWLPNTCMNQGIYDSTNFTGQGIFAPMVINNLEWRAASGVVTTQTVTYPQVNLYLGYSATDYLTPSTTFASNRTASHTLVYSGPVTVNLAAGGSPNTYVINVPLTTPFTYDPTIGQDLLLEINILAAPTPALGTTMSTGNVPATHLCNSVRNTASATAITGSLSGFCCVARFGYTVPANSATAVRYGTGCYDRAMSYYENFANGGTFDLSNSSVLMVPNGVGGYVVTPGSNQFFTPLSADLALGDDTVSPPLSLPFTLTYPGGSTSSIYVSSNGHVGLNATGASTSGYPAPATFTTAGATLAPFWTDLDSLSSGFGTGTITYDVDAPNNVVYVTWTGVAVWEATPSTPRFLNTFQVAIYSSGNVEFRYQTCSAPTSIAVMTGFTPGTPNRNPGNRDISATLPFNTGTDQLPLALTASARPVLGNSINLVTSNIPGTAVLSATLLSFVQHNPGLPLAGIGMPGCQQYVNLDATYLVFGSPTAQITLGMPTGPSWLGAHVFSQSASLVPGVNALGAESSNGLDLRLGSL